MRTADISREGEVSGGMATSVETARRTATDESPALTWVVNWIKSHRQATGYIATALIVAAGLVWWNVLSSHRSEAVAGEQLTQARLGFESKNFALAASELSRIIANYSGTKAAQEGTLLLAQVRLGQGQSQQAIEVLKEYAPRADKDYRAQAYGLLGAAYENLGHPKEAAQAYLDAAGQSEFPFLRGQYLSDAGRALVAAGDTSRAMEVYGRIVREMRETGAATEAKVRLGELTKGAQVP